MSRDWRDPLIVKSTTMPKSKYLRQLYKALEAGGWTVSSRGAPDFFATKKMKDGRVGFIAVEAVRKKTYRLRRHQRAVIEALARCGVPCFRYNCDAGTFEEINFKPPRGVVPPAWEEAMAKRAKRVMEPDWVETRIKCTFPQALRLVQRGRKASRTGWDPSILYISRNRTLGLVELVCGGKDGEGFCYSVPYLGGAGIGGPPVKDLLAEDWFIVVEDDWFTPEFLREEIPVPTLKGGKRAEAALLAEIAAE